MEHFKNILGRQHDITFIAERTERPKGDQALRLSLINLSGAPVLVHGAYLVVGSLDKGIGTRNSRIKGESIVLPGARLELLSSELVTEVMKTWSDSEARIEALVLGGDIEVQVPVSTGERDFVYKADVKFDFGFFEDNAAPWAFTVQGKRAKPSPEAVKRLGQW